MEMLTQRMKRLLGPFVLRRLKADVAGQLAPKDQRVAMLDMTPVQAGMYTEAVGHLHKHAAAAGVPEGDCPDLLSTSLTHRLRLKKPHNSAGSSKIVLTAWFRYVWSFGLLKTPC